MIFILVCGLVFIVTQCFKKQRVSTWKENSYFEMALYKCDITFLLCGFLAKI